MEQKQYLNKEGEGRMYDQHVGKCTCFLCGEPAELYPNFGDYYAVDCELCGEYQISDSAVELKSYNLESRFIAAGEAFNSFFYGKRPLLLKDDHFKNPRAVKTIEKLYSLAKYIYTVSRNGSPDIIPCRPACCYAAREEYYDLLRELKKLDVLDFQEKKPTITSFFPRFFNIKMSMKGKIAFENGIETELNFEEAFMQDNRPITNTLNNYGTITDSNIQQGQQNTITESNIITEQTVEKKLLENGISPVQIEALKPIIIEVVKEYNQPKVDKSRWQAIFTKIKEFSGKIMLNAFNFIAMKGIEEVYKTFIS